MKFIFPLLAAGMLLLSSCAEKLVKPGSSAKELSILTYNIHHANPPSRTDFIDIDAIVKVIKDADPDLVGLQEMDKFTTRSGNIDQTKVIAEKTGMHYQFFKAINYGGGEYGIAILSKQPFKNVKQLMLPKAKESHETRTMGYMDVELGSGQKVTFACTHLSVESEDGRELQVKAIQEELAKISNPVILCGDLNSSQGSPSISLLQQQFKNSCTDNCGFTIPADHPKRNIDFILTKNANWQVKNYRVVNETYASDHRPVAATFRIKP